MSDVSNRTIVALLAVALVVSVAGTMYSVGELGALGGDYAVLSGAISTSSTGQLDFAVTSITGITLLDSDVSFGAGSVNSTDNANNPLGSAEVCVMETDAGAASSSPRCLGAWATQSENGLIIENTGNSDADISYTSSDDAATLIGGTLPQFEIKADCAEASGVCVETIAAYAPVNTATTALVTDLKHASATDAMAVDFRVSIPEDANVGAKSSTITFVASP
jgi:hypothetical protein